LIRRLVSRRPCRQAAVAPEPYVVRVVFANGEVGDVDIEPILDGPIFRALRDPVVFGRVAVDECGEAVAWPMSSRLGAQSKDTRAAWRPRRG